MAKVRLDSEAGSADFSRRVGWAEPRCKVLTPRGKHQVDSAGFMNRGVWLLGLGVWKGHSAGTGASEIGHSAGRLEKTLAETEGV